MNDMRFKHLFLALAYFFVVVLLAGVTMILVSKSLRDVHVFWLVKQTLPAAILASFLAIGILAFDRIEIPYPSVVERTERIKGLLPFVPLGGALFLVSGLLAYAASGTFPNNNVYVALPFSRFLPYFISVLVFTGFVQPVLEEIIFRGRIFPIARGVLGGLAATLLVSALFSALHYSNLYSSFIFSVVMCIVASRFGIRACIVTHISYNIVSILVDAF